MRMFLLLVAQFMINSRFKKKILLAVITAVFALCIGIGAVFCVTSNSSNGGNGLAGNLGYNGGTLNGDSGDYGADFTYTYGQSYTIGGIDYTLGAGEKEYIDYKTALGLGDSYTVKLKSFTYPNGTDGTAQADGVRNAGTYELIVESHSAQGVFTSDYSGEQSSVAVIRVGQAPIDFSNIDDVPVFVNANAPTYKAHGDITAIYKHNDGWYPSQKAGEVPVEIRTITNAYYYETGNEVPIKIAGEELPLKGDGKTDVKSTTSKLEYKGITLNIKDRTGTVFIDPNEYIATFTFYLTDAQKSNYYFYYGDVTDDDEIKDANKGLSITQRTEDSFVLSKHWFIAKYASLFVATDDTANYPYVPFHDNDKIEAAGGVTNISGSNVEGENGETNTATDTVTYTEALTVKIPVAKFICVF